MVKACIDGVQSQPAPAMRPPDRASLTCARVCSIWPKWVPFTWLWHRKSFQKPSPPQMHHVKWDQTVPRWHGAPIWTGKGVNALEQNNENNNNNRSEAPSSVQQGMG